VPNSCSIGVLWYVHLQLMRDLELPPSDTLAELQTPRELDASGPRAPTPVAGQLAKVGMCTVERRPCS
jgi:hypothetical protein